MKAMWAPCVLIVALASACSYTRPDDVPNNGGDDAHGPFADAGSGQGDGGFQDAASGCTAAPSYGSLTPSQAEQLALDIAGPPHELIWQGTIDGNNIRASFQLTGGVGPFAGGDIHAGNFQLGAELDLNNCGVCVALIKVDNSQMTVVDYYVATGGGMSLNTIAPQVIGSMTDVTFTHVVKDGSGHPTATLDPSCKSQISHLTISSTEMQQ